MNTERALVLVAVALAGLAGLGTLGGSLHAAVGAGVAADAPTGATALTDIGRGSSAVGAEAGLASALSDVERLAENYAAAPLGLYAKLERKEPRATQGHAIAHWSDRYRYADRVRPFSPKAYVDHAKRNYPQRVDPAHLTERDLLMELSRLDLWRVTRPGGRVTRPGGRVTRGASSDGSAVRWSEVHAFVLSAIQSATVGRSNDIRRNLAAARAELKGVDRPIPEAFFQRIAAVAQIHNRGIPEERFERLFRPAGSAAQTAGPAGADAFYEVLGRLEGPPVAPGSFALRYFSDAEDLLGDLEEGARSYLAAEVLPLLRQTSGEAGRVLTEEGEARALGRIVGGDANGALAALSEGRTRKSAEVPTDLAEAVRFAASLFEPAEVEAGARLRPFAFEELTELVRLDEDALTRLAGRAAGGAELAEVARAMRTLPIELLPGRTSSHVDTVFTEWLRTVARGDRAGFEEYAGHAKQVVREVPALLREVMEDLLKAFSSEGTP